MLESHFRILPPILNLVIYQSFTEKNTHFNPDNIQARFRCGSNELAVRPKVTKNAALLITDLSRNSDLL